MLRIGLIALSLIALSATEARGGAARARYQAVAGGDASRSRLRPPLRGRSRGGS